MNILKDSWHKTKTYLKASIILHRGEFVGHTSKALTPFIVRGAILIE